MSNTRRLIQKIVSGGQTGVDRAALDTALDLGIPCGGWCPKGHKAEDGVIPDRYGLKETPTDVYSERTELNVRDSDATFVLVRGEAEGGTLLTIQLAEKYDRPYFLTQIEAEPDVEKFFDWIREHNIRVLNIAGHRESFAPGVIYECSKRVLNALLTEA